MMHELTNFKFLPSALLPLTVQDHIPDTFPLLTGWKMKAFYFPWLTNFNSPKMSQNYCGRKGPKI
jgi:hypothetical protein